MRVIFDHLHNKHVRAVPPPACALIADLAEDARSLLYAGDWCKLGDGRLRSSAAIRAVQVG